MNKPTDKEEYFLLFDKSGTLERQLKQPQNLYDPPLMFINMFGKFKKILNNLNINFLAIIIDIDLNKTIWTELLKECHRLRPAVPIFLMTQNISKLKNIDKMSLGVSEYLDIKTDIETITQKINTSNINNFQEINMTNPNSSSSADENMVINSSEKYISISISAFKMNIACPFNIFIKLQSEKYLKIINKGDSFTKENILKHEEKGINNYYIKDYDYLNYVSYYEDEIKKINDLIVDDFEDTKIKFLDFGEEVESFMEEWGVHEANINMAKTFVEKSGNIINQMAQNNSNIKTFLEDLANIEHAVSVCMIGGLLLNKIGAKKEIYDEIAMACMLHDIGLINTSDNIKSEDESKMNEDEKKVYYNHPKKGADILEELNFKGAIVEAVHYHHLLPKNKGFPKMQNGEKYKINPIAELIRLSETLIILNQKSIDKEINKDPITYFKENYIDDYSSIIQRSYNSVFKV